MASLTSGSTSFDNSMANGAGAGSVAGNILGGTMAAPVAASPVAATPVTPAQSTTPQVTPAVATIGTPSTTMDAASLTNSKTTAPITLPPAAPLPNPQVQNAAVPNPTPVTPSSAADIISKDTATTDAQTKQTSLLGKLSTMVQPDLATQKAQQEKAAGLGALGATVKSLSAKLQGLSDQSDALTQETSYYTNQVIPNQEQLGAFGRGITAAGLAPQQADDLRLYQMNQATKQHDLVSQTLATKAALLAAQNDYSNAQNAADNAAQVAFGLQEQQINTVKAQLDSLAPKLTKDETNQASQVKADLDERTDAINRQKEDYKTGIAMVSAAMKNNPDDAKAQYAAQQALKIQATDPDYLQKVTAMIGKYQDDQTQRDLDTRLKQAQIGKIYADMANTPGTVGYNKNQDKLEQQYRAALLKEVSNRSGSIGLQDQKVNTATHLMSLVNQYKDKNGNYNIPKAQYAELVMGLANLVSPTGATAEADRANLMSKTAAGDLKGALQYITGTPQNGNTQAIIKNLVDSIQRQGSVSENIRTQNTQFLQGLAPSGLEQDRIDRLNKSTLAPFDNGDPYRQIRSQLQPGNILVNRDGKLVGIAPSELWKTDVKL